MPAVASHPGRGCDCHSPTGRPGGPHCLCTTIADSEGYRCVRKFGVVLTSACDSYISSGVGRFDHTDVVEWSPRACAIDKLHDVLLKFDNERMPAAIISDADGLTWCNHN